MTNNRSMLHHQLETLADAVETCEASRRELLAAQARLEELEQSRAEQLNAVEHRIQQDLDADLSRLTFLTQAQRETLDLDFRNQSESFRSQNQQALLKITLQTTDQLARLTAKEDNEVWVLQSVFDEEATDSPREKFDREREAFHTQRAFLQERTELLERQIGLTRQFLAECHAATDIEYPEPKLGDPSGTDLIEIAREAGDQVLTEAGRIEALTMPQWVRKSRVWLLCFLLSLVVFFPVLLIRADDLNGFLNPDLAEPNWRWLAVSSVISAFVGIFVGVTLMFRVQQRLRQRFSGMLQHASNSRRAVELWGQRSDARFVRMERASKKWVADLIRRREQRTQQLRTRFASEREALDEKQNMAQSRFESECATQDKRLQAASDAELERITAAEQQEDQRLRADASQRIERERAEYLQRHQQESAACKRTAEQLLGQWKDQLAAIRRLTQESGEIAAGGRGWPALAESGWNPPNAMPPSLTPGDLLVTIPKPPETPLETPSTNVCVELPAVLRFPNDTSILVEHDAAGREAALQFVRTQILRLLTLIPPGRIRLTLIDPVGLGQSFSAMMHLADYDELLIHGRIWTDESQIREQLRKITIHMENIFQTYLRSEFATIEEYNESAGEVAEPYHFVVVAGFPQAFSSDAARHLSSILTSGPNCGVHALIAWNPALPSPPGFDLGELTSNCVHFQVRGGDVVPARKLPASLVFEAFPEPPAADYVQMVKAVGEKSKDARRVEVSFRRVAPRADAVWTQSTSDGIDLPIGRAGAARLQFLRLGRGTSQHVMVAGKTGSGKSTFLHIVVTNLALHFSPSEIQFYLIDFKKGVEFRTYAANRLPHVRVVAIESDREFGLSVLERLDEILQERGELFRSRGVQDVPAFRRQFSDEPMPRLLLLIDEFQEFFIAEDRVASRASLLLDRLIRQGRAFGIHVMLGSQTLGGAYSLARSTLGQVAVRIALQCSETDAHLILSEDNSAARLLTRPGEAIYNDANGLKEGNHPFQIAWLDEEYREELIRGLADRPMTPGVDSSMIVFEGNVAPTVEQCAPLRAALQSSADATQRSFDAPCIWLGEPVAIAAPTQVQLRRAGGQNLLLVGQDEGLIDSMLALTILSTCHRAGEEEPQLTLLHSTRNEDVVDRFSQLRTSAAVGGFHLYGVDRVAKVVQDLTAELKQREESFELSTAPERMLVIRDLGQFRDLRREDDDFSLGSFGQEKAATTASLFGEIIRRGPLVGIHVVVWSDTFSNAMRWLSTNLLREFENRIVLRMNQTDSASLVDSPVAAGLGPGRAILYRDQTGTVEKFRPFAWPTDEWLRHVALWRSGESDDGLDIESLRIE